MATSILRPPLYNGHLYTTATIYTTATSILRPPLYNGHLYTTATSTQLPPLHNGHLYTTATSIQRPPLYYDHLYTTAASKQRPPLYNGHLYTTATSIQRPPLHNDHLYTTATSKQRPPLNNGHLYTTATSIQRPPLYYDHKMLLFKTSPQRPPLYNGHLYTTTTSILRPQNVVIQNLPTTATSKSPNPQSTTDEYKCTDQSALYPNFNTNKQQFCSRGHLTPNADFSTADERKLTMINTNIAPQWQLFNGMNWAFLEAAVRKYATNVNRPVYVFTGVGGQAKNGVVDIKLQGTIVAPQYYWKAICDPTAKESIVFVGENSVGVISEDKVAGCNGRSQTKKKGVVYCYSLQGAQAAYSTEGFKLPPFGDNCAPSVKGTFMDALLSTLV
ncbi:hypothetical protein QZH41_017995 [Actinostola sp. cb2023]|nr:hypothetical protein QZH41_017995 [Actinostola sp. cb2023]